MSSTVTGRRLDTLATDVGELLARGRRGGTEYGRYTTNPVGFLSDVLHATPWDGQIEIAEAVRDHAMVTVRSCHAAGKDWHASRLALWWVYARGGVVVLTGPTAAQVEEILMRGEVRTAFLAGGLPGELHVRALRPGGSGAAGILARTADAVHGLTGLHAARVLYIVTEAQDPSIDHAWDAAFAVCTGAEDRILTLGNPTEPDGRFYRAHQPGSGWHAIRIAADDIPNVREGRTAVPGLLTREGVERFRREYGEASPFYVSRVLAEFPSEATDGLVTSEWIDRAVELHGKGALHHEAARSHYVLGVDPARLGPDRSVVCVRRGPVVKEFIEWRGADTMTTADRVQAECRRLLADYRAGDLAGGAVEAVYVDEIGLGGGVLDRLRETLPRLEWVSYAVGSVRSTIYTHHVEARAFNASAAAPQPERFSNARAQSFWTLRKLLEDGRLGLPDVTALREELLATRVRFGADGRTAIESKDVIAGRIGRSPDYADALAISLAPMMTRGDRKRYRAGVWVR